ncbi:MAG TPA: helix-turn-helix domain-containing protein, partial [Chitinophagaceae bacterium]
AKYLRSALSQPEIDAIHQRLTILMKEQRPYTDPDLTLNHLAKALGINPNHLSQVINTREQKNFYDLVNQKRVEEFIRLSATGAGQQYTLLSLAYDCGFNSKASFNRNFKKHTGHTPSGYLKQQPALREGSSPMQ